MAPQAGSAGGADEADTGRTGEISPRKPVRIDSDDRAIGVQEGDEELDEDGEDDEDDEEPRLKYHSLTEELKAIYRNGDATSTFMVAGDKMIVGTHNGNINILAIPSLQPIRTYHAHTASTSALSISPYPPPLAPVRAEAHLQTQRTSKESPVPSIRKAGISPSPKGPKVSNISQSPSNAIHVGSASIDGNVCIQSLVDSRDVVLRNFGRPIKALGLSPEYKSDRSFLSGGLAGLLVLTTGGPIGARSTASTSGSAAAASGWLGSIGIGSTTGKDQVLHSGEGAISTIKWSLSGKYVVWVNEQGIKIMRSNLRLESAEGEAAWKRISHIDHPNRPGWEEMAGIWKAHVEWVDEAGLEVDHIQTDSEGIPEKADSSLAKDTKVYNTKRTMEKLIVGWSGTIWIINVYHGGLDASKGAANKHAGRAEVKTILRIDCIVSGIALYTSELLIVLAYVIPEADTTVSQKKTNRGVLRRHNALQPEMRIIDVNTKEEVSIADTLDMTRFESLSATDYHLGILPAIRARPVDTVQRGALETIGGGIEAIGGGIWDATMYPARLFNSSASVHSGEDSDTNQVIQQAQPAKDSSNYNVEGLNDFTGLDHGMKIFIHSPYNCILATKPRISDHFSWLDAHGYHEQAWELLNKHPEAMHAEFGGNEDSKASTTRQASLTEFLSESSFRTASIDDRGHPVQQQLFRTGEKWLHQLVKEGEWTEAGRVAGKVLSSPSAWEYWVSVFAKAQKCDEITPHIPTEAIDQPLPSIVYETLLNHYISHDRSRLHDLLEIWPPELYETHDLIENIEMRFQSGEIVEVSNHNDQAHDDWRILMKVLAKFYIAAGTPRKALRCYILLQDADAAMKLITDSHLVNAVADDIPGFLLLKVSKEEQKNASIAKLADLTLEAVQLLVSEAYHGIVLPEVVVGQLKKRYGIPNPYLYFYFRALWKGDAGVSAETKPTTARTMREEERLIAQEGKTFVSDFADIAVNLFAEYDRPLLMTFLKASPSYTLSYASELCEQRSYIPELVYLLSKEGRTAQALRLIIDSLGDVRQAIAFAKEQDDARLWDDLIDYSMSKPAFIRALLEEVGTAIDPLKLVQRIPLGMEIEGLREGLNRMLRGYEVQESISNGVAKVLYSEVNAALRERQEGMRKAIRFDIGPLPKAHQPDKKPAHAGTVQPKDIKPGHCASCGESVRDPGHPPRHLLAFSCSHVFHLACLITQLLPPGSETPDVLEQFLATPTWDDFHAEGGGMAHAYAYSYDWGIGPKVDQAKLLRDVLKAGCPLEEPVETNDSR